jgi:hypothetical protein
MANPDAIERHGERFAIHPVDAQRNAEYVYSAGGSVTVDNGGTFAVQATQAGTWNVGVTKTALTPSAPAAATVGITSAQAVAANANRKGLVLVNTSANYISLGFGAAAVLYSGITLNPYGGTFVMDEYTYNTGAVYAIASAATSNLGVQEMA